jgi:hypothetical protein
MAVKSACQASLPRVSIRDSAPETLAAKNLRRPQGPRCGSIVLVAEQSRFNPQGRIDHDWSCDGCGNAFATSVRVFTKAA